ncbi:MAG: hypothetical protein WCS72_14650, partial [Deltaproteobacteria bacterium]
MGPKQEAAFLSCAISPWGGGSTSGMSLQEDTVKPRGRAVAMAMGFSASMSAMAPTPPGAYGVRKAMLGHPGPSCGAARSCAMRRKVCMEHAFAPVDEYGGVLATDLV